MKWHRLRLSRYLYLLFLLLRSLTPHGSENTHLWEEGDPPTSALVERGEGEGKGGGEEWEGEET